MSKATRPTRDRLALRLADHLAAGMDTAPIERFQHGQELATKPMTRAPLRIANGVEILYAAKAISDAELISAERFYRDYVGGLLGVRCDEILRVSGMAHDPHVMQLARCQAVTAYHAVASVLGPERVLLLVALVVHDLSFAAMARRFGTGEADGRKKMSARCETLLVVLTGLYAMLDRRMPREHAREQRVAAGALN